MVYIEIAFWLAAAGVLYTYLGYPLLMAGLARFRAWPVQRGHGLSRSVSIVLAAYNEEVNVARRLVEFTELLTKTGLRGEILVVSDGSMDATAEVARSFSPSLVRVIELADNRGKAAALNLGCAAARHEILVLADARQSWEPDALGLLLENFTDPSVGAVSGDLVVDSGPGVMAGVGGYWRFEKWLRGLEGRVHSTVGVTGAICCLRRELFRPLPPGTILDDVYWPLQVVLQGYRVVHDDRAHALDRLPDQARAEFRRKVRTLGGNFQLLARLPAAWLPGRNPIWWQVLSHKALRLLCPWLLLVMLTATAFLNGPVYRPILAAQVYVYLLGTAGLVRRFGARCRPAAVTGAFLVLNLAAWAAFWMWLSGRVGRSWCKTTYQRI